MKWFEILSNGTWIEVDIKDIKKGEIFRVFENGLLYEEKGISELKATSDAYYCRDWEVYMVDYECFYGGRED